MQSSVKGGLETIRLKVSLMVGLVLDLSIAKSSISYCQVHPENQDVIREKFIQGDGGSLSLDDTSS